jgi:hypothetical protein
MKFTIEERVFIVENFARKKCIRKFRRKYFDPPVPTMCVFKLVKKWRATGSGCDIKKQVKRIVLTEEKVRDTEARLQFSPRKLLRCLAQETGVLLSLVPRDSDARMTALAKVNSKCKRQTRPLVEVASHINKPRTGSNKNLVLGLRWGLTPRQTGRLIVGRNITLTLTLTRVNE